MTKNIFIIFLFSVSTTIFAYQYSNDYGTYVLQNGVGRFTSKDHLFSFVIYKKKNNWIIKMQGKTKGWIAVGFDRTKQMRDSEIILGYVKNKQSFLRHEYSIGYFIHKLIKDLDGSEPIISLITATEINNLTSISFSRKINVNGKFYKDLAPGKEVKLLYAIGGSDNFKQRHTARGIIKIKLP